MKVHIRENNVLFFLALTILVGGFVMSYQTVIYNTDIAVVTGLLLIVPLVLMELIVTRSRKKVLKERVFMCRSVVGKLINFPEEEFKHFIRWIFEKLDYKVENINSVSDSIYDAELDRSGNKYKAKILKTSADDLVSIQDVSKLQKEIIISDSNGGLFLTTGGFTDTAKNYAVSKSVYLMNGQDIAEIVSDFYDSKWHDLLFVSESQS